MSLTPVEIRHVRLGRRPLGYGRGSTDRLLADIAASFEDVWRGRADLRDEIERLESELHRQREVEEALRNTLLSAERLADELRARAHREADLIVEEARAKAREITGGAEAEREEETYDNHLADSATATLNREIDYTLEENAEQMLSAIDGALLRIENGTYGTCVRCGRPIAEERLEAIPYATRCIDCQRLAERG